MKALNALPPPIFIGGALALDFLNSVATPVDVVVEWIGNGDDLLSWMKQAGLLTAEDVKTIRRSLSTRQLDVAANEARGLRDWFRGFVRKNMGRPLTRQTSTELGPLNKRLVSDNVFWRIEPAKMIWDQGEQEGVSPPVLRLRPQRRWPTPDSLLCPVAEEMAKFICAVDFRCIKACEGGKCTLLFLDQSHRHGRKWCSMAICGNRAKAAAFAARSKQMRKKKINS